MRSRRRRRVCLSTHWLVIVTLLGNLLATNLAQAAIAAQRSPDQILVTICSSAGVRLVVLESRPDLADAPQATTAAAPKSAFPASALPEHNQGPGHCDACLGHPVSALPAVLPITTTSVKPLLIGIAPPVARQTGTRLLPGAMPRAPPAPGLIGMASPARA